VLAADLAQAKQKRDREREIQLVHQLPLSSSSCSSHNSDAKEEAKELPEARELPGPASLEEAEPRVALQPGPKPGPAPGPAPGTTATQQPVPTATPVPMLVDLEEVTPDRRRPARLPGKKPASKEYVYEERESKRIQQPLQLLGPGEEHQARLAQQAQSIRRSITSVSDDKVDEMLGYLSQVIARDRIPEDEDIRQFEQRFRRYLSAISPADLIHLYQLLHLQVQIGR